MGNVRGLNICPGRHDRLTYWPDCPPSNLVAAAHSLDDAWTQQTTAREDEYSEQTHAAVTAYQGGLVLADDELQSHTRGSRAVSTSGGDPFFEHDFCPSTSRTAHAFCDVMGADVHHAALAVALVRMCDRDVADSDPQAALGRIRFQLKHANRACLYRLSASVALDSCLAIVLRYTQDSTLVVAVAPTQTLKDVLTSCSMNLIPPSATVQAQLRLPPGVRVHDGWAAAAALLWPKVEVKILAEQAAEAAARGLPHTLRPLRVVFSGHSLGAALATLLAMAAGTPSAPASLVTFGGPRVGDAAFQAASLDRTTHNRVVVDGDTVPRLPFGLTAAVLHMRGSYAPVAAAHHWKLADSPAPTQCKVFQHRADSEGRFQTPLLSGLLFGLCARHSFDVYKKYLTKYYDTLVHKGAGSSRGPPS